MTKCGFARKEQEYFRTQLHNSMQPSVDAFLEKRPRLMHIGKAAISCALIPYEQEATLLARPKKPRWYEHLFAKMDAGWEQFAENKLSIITFNYDRSFEHFLFLALRHSYGKAEAETAALLGKFPIVHVYGQLGKLPYLAGMGRPYDNNLSPDVVRDCASEITIFHESDGEAAFYPAHQLLRAAKRICFLGFGYLLVNLQRLRLKDVLQKKTDIYGSTYGLGLAEREGISNLLNGLPNHNIVKLGEPHEDVLDVLRNYSILD